MIIQSRRNGRTEDLILGIWFATLLGQNITIAVPTRARANQIRARLRMWLTSRQFDRVTFTCGDDPPKSGRVVTTIFDDLRDVDL